jgi:hypothetical protein
MYPCCGYSAVSLRDKLCRTGPERMRVAPQLELSSRGPKAEGCAFRLRRDPSGELDFGVVLICLSKLAKNLALLTLPDSQRISVRMKLQFISISVVRHCEPTPANKISYDQTVQFALSDAQAAFQFVPFGRSVSVINCDSEKRKRRMQLVWNEHLHKNSGGVPPIIFSTYSEYQQWAGVSAKHCEALPLQVEYCERR